MMSPIFIIFFATAVFCAEADPNGEDIREKRHTGITAEGEILQNIEDERRSLIKEKLDIVNDKPDRTDVNWNAYKQKWKEYGQKWDKYYARQNSESIKRDKRDVHATGTVKVSKNLETERRQLAKAKEDIINEKPSLKKRMGQVWNAYKWEEYEKKWVVYHTRRDLIRNKRIAQVSATDEVSQNLETEKLQLIKEKEGIANEKLEGNKRNDEDWSAYKLKWAEHGKKWDSYHIMRNEKSGERDNRDTESEMHAKWDAVGQQWNVYGQKLNEYGKKWERKGDKTPSGH